MQQILEISHLTKNYNSIKGVDNLSLVIEKGQVYGILGPNGSGKTTTLSIIMGVVRQSSGDFSWFDKTGEKVSRRRNVGSLIEVPNFYPYLSLAGNLKITALIKNVSFNDIERVLKITLLTTRIHSPYHTLSLGMKQRLAIAAALLGDPEVLVLDEPTNGLDPEGIAEVRNIILQEAEKGKTVILASHILAEVEKVCTHVAVLKKGRLLASGKVDELIGSARIFHISAADIDRLELVLSGTGMIKSFSRAGDDLVVNCTGSVTAEELNKLAFDNNIILSRLVPVKKSLESQFLELVK
jgi:ABC-type multidrug transport system ATPase subunit